MYDFILEPTEDAGPEAHYAEFFLATVNSWSNANGIVFTIDGESQTQRGYKMMLMCRPLKVGSRVVVMKQSGTYVVLGEISLPNSHQAIPDLSSSANLATVISKINTILAWMRTQGMLWTS